MQCVACVSLKGQGYYHLSTYLNHVQMYVNYNLIFYHSKERLI